MQELIRTNDPVLISWAIATLADHDIGAVVLDTHTSIIEGSIGILPRRIMVSTEDYSRARHILETSQPETGDVSAEFSDNVRDGAADED